MNMLFAKLNTSDMPDQYFSEMRISRISLELRRTYINEYFYKKIHAKIYRKCINKLDEASRRLIWQQPNLLLAHVVFEL